MDAALSVLLPCPPGGSSATPISLQSDAVWVWVLGPHTAHGHRTMGEDRMIRRIATATAAGALALGVLAVTGMGSAGAVVTITAGPGSTIHCTTLKAKATLA